MAKHQRTDPEGMAAPAPQLDRRRMLTSIAAGAAFAVPTIVTVRAASAQTVRSPVPGGVGGTFNEGPVVGGVQQGNEDPGVDDTQTPTVGRTALPRTGIESAHLTAAGLAAVAGGGALVVWGKEAAARAAAADLPPVEG